MVEEKITKMLNEKASGAKLEEKEADKKAKAKGQVTVCCGIPMGVKLVRHNGEVVLLAGMPLSNIVSARDGNFLPAGKFGTTILNKEIWLELKEKYKEFDFIKNGTVFAEDTYEGAKEKAVEKSKGKLGFEQFDPNKSTRTKKKSTEE